MSVVQQVLQYRRKLVIKVFDARILVNVQIQEVAKSVVICLEVEHVEALVQCF
jgi:hypothetical protein